jgi:hypothetical protein
VQNLTWLRPSSQEKTFLHSLLELIIGALLGMLMALATVDGPYGNLRVWAILMAVLSLTTGTGVLRRFLIDHPVIEDRMPDAN